MINYEFFSSYNPDLIEKKLIKFLSEDEVVDHQVSLKKYKVKFQLESYIEDQDTDDAV